MRQGTLMAVPFDLASRTIAGSPVAVAGDIRQFAAAWNSGPIAGAGLFDVASSGSLAYARGPIVTTPSELVWVDRNGRVTTAAGPFRGEAPMARVSPDGTRIAYATNDAISEAGMWVLDLARGTRTRMPHDGEPMMPIWSRDSQHLVFSSLVGGRSVVVRRRADGTGPEERLLEAEGMNAASLSPDGTTLALVGDAIDRTVVWRVGLAGSDRKPVAWLQSKFVYEDPEFSPDGRWLLFDSTESGEREVYIQEVARNDTPRVRISTGGGLAASWNANGREILFTGQRGEPRRTWVVGVTVDLTPGRPPVVGGERRVCAVPDGVIMGGIPVRMHDLSPDGSRFLTLRRILPPPQPPALHVDLIEHWFDELKQQAPPRR
jgi:Tol biopolymer transport system component